MVAEDLSKHIKGKKRAKAVNRRLNEWSKGELQKALDKNAALVIKNRASDFQITRFMKKEQVHKILLERTASFLADNGHSLESAISMGWLDEKHINQGKPPRRRR
ncbi:hypothetical protein F7734_43635 [Scytonema sp. UIC 10036]|uniref:hypothetical protein n=1 Tax=Scytonema sp. UIC 10036 TaxID=2304196 RepID=UPI0012DA43A6|nr:hypothetical protein [Scytonema sp. UIC 10036]MUG98823.1 hypothetical protein [Scytonema sp. UIC 10036]